MQLRSIIDDIESSDVASVSSADDELRGCQEEHLRESLNASLQNTGESPLKTQGIKTVSKTKYGKRKLERVNQAFKKQLIGALQTQLSESESDNDARAEIEKKAKSFDLIMEKVKQKIQDADLTRAQRIQLLTISPPDWSRKKIAEFFSVSERSIRNACALESESGILSMPAPRKGKQLPQATVDSIHHFYLDNENTRIMPGIKDRISISKNKYEQKRLILCTLKELYLSFVEANPNLKVGFSKFCTLRPKWCVSAGSSGTHFVCVCTIHQNVILLLQAAQVEESHKDLIKLMVCNEVNKDCMLGRCN